MPLWRLRVLDADRDHEPAAADGDEVVLNVVREALRVEEVAQDLVDLDPRLAQRLAQSRQLGAGVVKQLAAGVDGGDYVRSQPVLRLQFDRKIG